MGTPDPRVKWFVCLTLLVVGLMALGVGVLIGRENAALAENLVVAEGVVVRRYAVSGAGSNGSSARDYSADVAVASPPPNRLNPSCSWGCSRATCCCAS